MLLWLCCALVVCVAGGDTEQRPHPCKSPPLLEGSLNVVTQKGGLYALAKYSYDAINQRIRYKEVVKHDNKTWFEDGLLLYKEHVMYLINFKNKTCQKRNLTAQFHPMRIPCNATLLGQVVLGSLSAPGEGLLVNSWTGKTAEDQGQYVMTFTEYGCLPVTVLFNRTDTGWIVTNFFNIVHGIKDPSVFIPPPFCKHATLETEGDFFSAFF